MLLLESHLKGALTVSERKDRDCVGMSHTSGESWFYDRFLLD